jgi:SAM-dependent methyltransferase
VNDGPSRADEYRGSIVRRATGATSPLDPDWPVQRQLVRDIRRALKGNGSGTVLDVGCGGRPYEPWLAPGSAYVGFDTRASPSSVVDAWALAAALPVRTAAVDTVLCTQVLEHLPDPAAAIQEMARVLRPGGTLILTAPQAWFLHEEPFDFFRFTRYGLEALCRRGGLDVVQTNSQGGFWAMAAVFGVVHLGSYVKWFAERRGAPQPHGKVSRWRRLLAPLRWPMALVNLAAVALDAIPHPGIFAVNHLVVARKPNADSR